MLTDDALRTLLQSSVVLGSQRLPPRDSILILAKELSFLRLMASGVGQKVLTKTQIDSQDMILALNEIVRLCPSFLEQIHMRIAGEQGRLSTLSESDSLEGELNDKITCIRSAINELRINQLKFIELNRLCEEMIKTDCYGQIGKRSPIYSWHDIAHKLVAEFRLAMQPTNPTLRLGLSNNGPLQRFIAAVVPHITGERPNAHQVGKFLKDNPPPLAVPTKEK